MAVGKYRSRRSKKKKRGGGILDEAVSTVSKTVSKAKDIQLKVSDKLFRQARAAGDALPGKARKFVDSEKRVARKLFAGYMRPYEQRHPRRNVDLGAMAASIAKKHVYRKLGGGLDLSNVDWGKVVSTARQFADPIKEVQKAKKEYDQINLRDMARGDLSAWGKSYGHAVAGNAHVASAHAKGSVIAAPEAAPLLLPAANAFSGIGDGVAALTEAKDIGSALGHIADVTHKIKTIF